MRTALRLALVLILPYVCVQASAQDANPPSKWVERPFFARKAGQPVPPPQYYSTVDEQPAESELRIKVVRSMKKASISVVNFRGGPVFIKGVVKDFTGAETDQVLTCKLGEKMKVGIRTTIGGVEGVCGGLEQKDGKTLLKYTADGQELVLEVEIVSK